MDALSGVIDVEINDSQQTLKEKETLNITEKAEIKVLPPPPVALSPVHKDVIWASYTDSISFAWQTPEQGSFSLELSTDKNFNYIFAKQKTNKKQFSIPLKERTGKIYWRVLQNLDDQTIISRSSYFIRKVKNSTKLSLSSY